MQYAENAPLRRLFTFSPLACVSTPVVSKAKFISAAGILGAKQFSARRLSWVQYISFQPYFFMAKILTQSARKSC